MYKKTLDDFNVTVKVFDKETMELLRTIKYLSIGAANKLHQYNLDAGYYVSVSVLFT